MTLEKVWGTFSLTITTTHEGLPESNIFTSVLGYSYKRQTFHRVCCVIVCVCVSLLLAGIVAGFHSDDPVCIHHHTYIYNI